MNDPIVAEIRKHRDEHAKRFNHDLHTICADLMARQEKSGHRLVRLKPRVAAKKKVERTS